MISSGFFSGSRLASRLERFAPHLLETVRHEVNRLPDIGDLGREFDILRTDRRDSDRDFPRWRPVHELQWLPEAGAAVVGE